MNFTRDQLKAAYALNLCTVSVSQIIDYEDTNIMEQEYDAILNNLNLEQMPKDEALLKVLKQIMDTITFFRIQEGDKRFIDKDYQEKMRNAIWSAVPKIGMLVASGNPITMAMSLASQIGTGYMNYRRAKADSLREKEYQDWQLERAALDQFNGLRRELFDTAWRLSAEYNFPDQLRLSERQITQYNNILMDGDLIRKYERLDAIKEDFIAYPPFWYQLGNTANALARSGISLNMESREYYRAQAKQHFIQYRASNQHGLLREDPVSSACALELVDLLDINEDRELIRELLSEALRFSGRRNDILQLAAIGYLKMNEIDTAANLLNQLVNEQYNTNLNAQLLSSIYVASYFQTHSPLIETKYDILCNRVGEMILYPMPSSSEETLEEIENQFLSQQQYILSEKYSLVFNKFVEKYGIKFNKLIPAPTHQLNNSYSYFALGRQATATRKYEMSKLFSDKRKANTYKDHLYDAEVPFHIIDLLNDFFDACCHLDILNDDVQVMLEKDIESAIIEERSRFNNLQTMLSEGKFGESDMDRLLDLNFKMFIRKFMEDLLEETASYISSRTEMQDFILSEKNLADFCDYVGLPDPMTLYNRKGRLQLSTEVANEKYFDFSLLNGEGSRRPERNSATKIMISIIRDSIPRMVIDPNIIEFYTEEDPRIDRYFNNNSHIRKNGKLKAQVLAILDDKNEKGDFDLMFTSYGVIPVRNGIVKNVVSYNDVSYATDRPNSLYIDGHFMNKAIDLVKLHNLCKNLVAYAKLMPETSDIKIKRIEPKKRELKLPFKK